jgi:sugar lactone lactonase YvrE
MNAAFAKRGWWVLLIAAGAAQAAGPALPDIFAAAPQRLVPAVTVAQMPPNTFLENLVVDRGGRIFVTSHDDGRILRLERGQLLPFARTGGKVAGLALGGAGTVVATGVDSAGMPTVFRVNARGAVTERLPLPDAQFLNGITALGSDRYLVADSYKGAVWWVDLKQRSARVWLQEPLLARADEKSPFPAANGVQRRGSRVWISNTAKQLLLTVDVLPDGSAGPLKVVRERVNIDDFVVQDNGDVIAATHVYNSLISVSPGGEIHVLAGVEQGMTGSTAVALGRSKSDAGYAYVTTNGGMFLPPPSGVGPSKLVRVRLTTH